jgi:hypothetical protein
VIGNGWFKKKKKKKKGERRRKITSYSWDSKYETAIHYFIMNRNLWNILNNVKVGIY